MVRDQEVGGSSSLGLMTYPGSARSQRDVFHRFAAKPASGTHPDCRIPRLSLAIVGSPNTCRTWLKEQLVCIFFRRMVLRQGSRFSEQTSKLLDLFRFRSESRVARRKFRRQVDPMHESRAAASPGCHQL